jgi:hypothetical protein
MIAGIIAGAFVLFLLLVKAAIGLLVFVFVIWMLVHAITSKGLSDGEKIAWVLAIIFLPFLGALLYFFFGKSKGRGIGD